MKLRRLLLAISVFLVMVLPMGLTIKAEIPSSSQTTLTIMTTIAIPYDVVKSVAGPGADIESVVDSTTDIHSFDGPTSVQLDKMVNIADVIFAMGIEDSEPWLQPIIDDNPSLVNKIVNLTDISTDGIADPLLENEINEHLWMDPNIVKKMANATTAKLVELDSANSAIFESANATYQTKLDTLLTNIEGNKTVYFNGMKVVSNHPAFLYLFELLGIERLAVIQSHEHGAEPDPQHINEIVDIILAETENITIVTSPQHSSDHAIEIAQATNSKMSVMSAIPGDYQNQGGKLVYNFEALDYISVIEHCMHSLRNPVDPPKSIPGFGLLAIGISGIIGISFSAIFVRKRLK